MTEVVPVAPPEHDEELLDRIDALRVLRADSPEEKGRLLEEIAGSGKVEQEIVSQLSKVAPLWRPAQFDGAHRMAMRSLEVLDRNGARAARHAANRPAEADRPVLRPAGHALDRQGLPERADHEDPQALAQDVGAAGVATLHA